MWLNLFITATLTAVACCVVSGPYNWMGRDKFDEIMDKMALVNEKNCHSLSTESLQLPEDSVGQIPRFNILPQIIIFPNRTNLIHMHNMALNRGYFYSFILQKLNASESDFPRLPGMMYYYLSASADVSSSSGLMNGSGVLFDTNCQYANWYPNILRFNHTLPLFGPKAFLVDDYNDPVNWLREPSNGTIRVDDLGSGFNRNYTASWHRLNPFVIMDRSTGINFIPDKTTDARTKHQYDYSIYSAKLTGQMETEPNVKSRFFGPPSPGTTESYHPVYFSKPYFDCGHSNKWIVSAVGPVVDYMVRYSKEINLRRPQIVATTVTDIDFLRIDFDPCHRADQSSDKTYFSGTARCTRTTLCEPLAGYGFQRGGYMCHCLPGYRYPYWQNGPFMGWDLEQASEEEAGKFECIPVDWKMHRLTEKGTTPGGSRRRRRRSIGEMHELSHLMQLYKADSMAELRRRVAEHDSTDRMAARAMKSRWPAALAEAARTVAKATDAVAKAARRALGYQVKVHSLGGEKSVAQRSSRLRRSVASKSDVNRGIFYLGRLASFDNERYEKAKSLIDHTLSVTPDNCAAQSSEGLRLPGEAAWGAERQFEAQARTALRLAHFISAFSQIVNPDEMYGYVRSDDKLNRHQLHAEVFANIMSDLWIRSSGIYFDREAFWDPELKRRVEYFGPTAYKLTSNQQTEHKQREFSFEAEDAAGWPSSRAYWQRDWFATLKQRWASNTYGLEKLIVNPYIRTDLNGTNNFPFMRFPLYYRAPRYEDLYWTSPYFDCNVDRDPHSRHIGAWVITAAAPFFGLADAGTSLKFLGVATVTVPLEKLDINQCPASFYEPNLFKNTAPCHYDSTYCAIAPRNEFALGNYKCECRQGYEYPYNDISIWFFAGGTVSDHYDKMRRDEKNYYRLLECREASGYQLLPCRLTGALAAIFAAMATWLLRLY